MIFICTPASVRASWHHSGHLATKKVPHQSVLMNRAVETRGQ